MIFDILSSFEVLFLFECNRYVRRFQHSREAEFRTSEFPNNWILHARNSNLGASQFWSRGVAILIPERRNSDLGESQFQQFLARRVAIPTRTISARGNSDATTVSIYVALFRRRSILRVAIPTNSAWGDFSASRFHRSRTCCIHSCNAIRFYARQFQRTSVLRAAILTRHNFIRRVSSEFQSVMCRNSKKYSSYNWFFCRLIW